MNTSARRLGAVGLAVTLSFALSSCGGEDAGDEPDGAAGEPSPVESSAAAGATDASGPSGAEGSDPSPESSPTPVAASSDGPAENWPEPEVPDEIYEETREGALAALEYWFEAATYMQLTGDSAAFESASESDCEICAARIGQFQQLYDVDEGWHVTEGASIEDPVASSVSEENEVSIIFTIREGELLEFDADGELRVEGAEESLAGLEALLQFQSDRWQVLELYFPDEVGAEN
ncbi:DUF6318 family protein [Nesterenkonia jeotgali]|uniref:DUF6318 domain-containing protein n=1 Tax=Nesterenkonia jeotgali TaxID=317018 RepID=A0A839FP09_9MICC|nr:DUF6318 family protein [Nesterenkonia jeotgali]MBA8921239.1 hypothetical protein [Nesterenkonia jeotgali]